MRLFCRRASVCSPPPVVGSLVAGVLACLAALALSPSPLAARPLTPEDVARLRQVEQVAIAPDGGAVAYRLQVPRVPFAEDDGRAWSELWVARPGEAPRAYVTGEVNVGAISWTPDGAGISFLAKRDGDEERTLYVIPRAGGEARRVLTAETGIDAYAWSPDGSRIAYLADEPREKARKALAEKGFDQVIYEEDLPVRRLWIGRGEPASRPAGADGAAPAGEAPAHVAIEGHLHAVRWCPGGEKLAVSVAPSPTVDDSYVATRIRILDAADGRELARVENPGKLGDFEWSPDCSRLAFIGAADANDPSEGRLMVVTAAGGPQRDLIPGYEGHVADLAWADTDTLVFIGDEGLTTVLYAIAADGGERRHVVPPGAAIWTQLAAGRRGPDGRLALALRGESPGHPDEAFFVRVGLGETTAGAAGAGNPERLSDSNPWLAEIDLAPHEVVAFTARDGLALEGVLIRPLAGIATAGSEAGRHPLIVVVHGGPEDHYRNGWLTTYSVPGQVGAGRGYAVFYPNYRGSTGRGVEFSKLSQGAPAGPEFDDLVDGVDHLVASGVADRARVGITGRSYGGYATAWGATYYSERFAAGVMFIGISDKISKLGTSDIPEEMFLVHERKRLWDDWQHFLEASPLYHAERGHTPLLILHGEDDPRVPPGQSLELHRALKTLGQAPVRLVLYPGEGHGNRRAASRYDYQLRTLRWFDHYLQGPGGAPPPPELDYPLQPEPEAE